MSREVATHGRLAAMPVTLATRALRFLAVHPTGRVFVVSGTPYEEEALWYYVERLLPLDSPLSYHADGPDAGGTTTYRLVDDEGRVKAQSIAAADVVSAEGYHGPVLFITIDAVNLHPDDFVSVLNKAETLASHAESGIIVASRPDSQGLSLDLFSQLTYDDGWVATEWRLDPPEPARYIPEPEPDPVEPDPDPDPLPVEPDPEETPDELA